MLKDAIVLGFLFAAGILSAIYCPNLVLGQLLVEKIGGKMSISLAHFVSFFLFMLLFHHGINDPHDEGGILSVFIFLRKLGLLALAITGFPSFYGEQERYVFCFLLLCLFGFHHWNFRRLNQGA